MNDEIFWVECESCNYPMRTSEAVDNGLYSVPAFTGDILTYLPCPNCKEILIYTPDTYITVEVTGSMEEFNELRKIHEVEE